MIFPRWQPVMSLQLCLAERLPTPSTVQFLASCCHCWWFQGAPPSPHPHGTGTGAADCRPRAGDDWAQQFFPRPPISTSFGAVSPVTFTTLGSPALDLPPEGFLRAQTASSCRGGRSFTPGPSQRDPIFYPLQKGCMMGPCGPFPLWGALGTRSASG